MDLCRTVQSLGVFNGAMLLGMRQDEIRAICPEEGGRVFFQLQSVRSSIAVSKAAPFVSKYKYHYLWSTFHCGAFIPNGHLMTEAELANVISLHLLCSLPVRPSTVSMVAADNLRTLLCFWDQETELVWTWMNKNYTHLNFSIH